MDGAATTAKERTVRALLLALGWTSVGLAFLGVVLPLVPTTPFVLLAAFAFARSSPRFHRWLREHRWFGEPLRAWEDHRAVPRRAKWTGLALLWITIPLSIVLTASTWPVAVALGALLLVATFFLARLPELA